MDTNVLLDLVLAREPWGADAATVIEAIKRGRARGFVAAHAITTVHYVVERATDRMTAGTAVADLLGILQVVPLTSAEFHRAIGLGLKDFEDAVQAAACLAAEVDYLVTRNEKDFKGAPVDTKTAGEIIALLGARPAA